MWNKLEYYFKNVNCLSIVSVNKAIKHRQKFHLVIEFTSEVKRDKIIASLDVLFSRRMDGFIKRNLFGWNISRFNSIPISVDLRYIFQTSSLYIYLSRHFM